MNSVQLIRLRAASALPYRASDASVRVAGTAQASKTTLAMGVEIARMVKILQGANSRIDTALPFIRPAATAVRPLAQRRGPALAAVPSSDQ